MSIFIPSNIEESSYTKSQSDKRFEKRNNAIVKVPGTFTGDFIYWDQKTNGYVSGSSKVVLGKNSGQGSTSSDGVFIGLNNNSTLVNNGTGIVNIGNSNSPQGANNSIVIGNSNCVFTEQKEDSIVLGRNNCQGGGGFRSISIGQNICLPSNRQMGSQVTAIGFNIAAVCGIGSHSVLLGANAGAMSNLNDIPAEVICINALASPPSTARVTGSCYISPIRGVSLNNNLTYNSLNGELGYVVSSERYKKNIRDFTDTENIYNLQPKIYDFKTPEGIDPVASQLNQISFIAEDVHRHLPLCAYTNDKGEIENYSDRALIACIVSELKKIRLQVDELKTRINVLESGRLP